MDTALALLCLLGARVTDSHSSHGHIVPNIRHKSSSFYTFFLMWKTKTGVLGVQCQYALIVMNYGHLAEGRLLSWQFWLCNQNGTAYFVHTTPPKPDGHLSECWVRLILLQRSDKSMYLSKFWTGPTLLNFSDHTRSGVFSMVISTKVDVNRSHWSSQLRLCSQQIQTEW